MRTLIAEAVAAGARQHDACQLVGVSARTLQYGFREVYGTTPRNFARSLRLTRSRMALQRAKRYTPINEIASAFGYEQIGQYSRDYRRWFGESPSMTLGRV